MYKVSLRKSKRARKEDTKTTAQNTVTQKPKDTEGTPEMNRDVQKEQETAINQWDAHVAILRG